MNVKEKLTQYFNLQEEIFKYFGYAEDYVFQLTTKLMTIG